MGGKKKKGGRFRNRNKKKEEREQSKAPYESNFTLTTVELGNFKLEAYYALQGIHNSYFNEEGKLVPCTTNEQKEEERQRWRGVIGEILPASFRIAYDIDESLKQNMEKELFEILEAQGKSAAEAKKEAGDETKIEVTTNASIQKLPFLPHSYQFAEINRKTIKKDPTLKDLFEWMKKQTEAGFITRQETVSMIPPVVMAPQPEDCVLDMCAAPGSKTCQILEKLSPKGCMVANDANYQRAYMLVNQLKRIMHNNPVVLVTNAEAQFFPQSLQFDRILADVPCSGDGTTRKNIGIWKQWNQLGALALHALQLDIAWKGVAMLKVGGYMVYSTCSYNPIENEAVVAELLRRGNGSIELVDAPLEGFKVRPGLSDWHVLAEEKSKREMANERKKNNAKMKERKAEWEKKQKEKEDGEGKNEEEAESAGTDKANGNKDEEGDKSTAEAGAAAAEAESGAKEADKKKRIPKFDPPSSWDDETLIGLTRTAGLLHMKTLDDIPQHLHKRVKKSCFPPTEEEAKTLHLEKCVRCLPHDNDTGGFFIALFKKTATVSKKEARKLVRSAEESEITDDAEPGPDLKRVKLDEGAAAATKEAATTTDGKEEGKTDQEMEEVTETSTKPKRELKSNRLEDGKGGKHKDVGRDDFVPLKEGLLPPLIEFFGFSESFPKDQIMTRAIGDAKVLYYLANSVKEEFIDKGIQKKVNIIGSGLKAFVRNTNWGSPCEYRLSQEAIHFVLPHMTKRKLVVDLDDFTKCLSGDGKMIELSEFSEEFSKAATDFVGGPFAVLLKGYETDYSRKLFLTMWRCRGKSVNTMVARPEIEGMRSKLAALKEE